MFDLEQSISKWRQQMLAAGIKSPVPLEELESHLREDIEQQVRAGADEARAFEIAAQRIGSPAPLKKEFMKTGNFKGMLWQTVKSLFGIRDVSLPALDAFAPAAQQTLELAPSEARCFNHNYVGTEHLLLGLTKSGSKSVSNVLQKLGVKNEALRREIERFAPVGPEAVTAAKIPYTPRAREALQLAAEEARNLNQPHIKAEHIFLGLLREGGGVAAVVLKNLGIRLEKARVEVLKEMTANPEAG